MSRKVENLPVQIPLLELKNVHMNSPEGRPLFNDLNMVIAREKVAMIGRNGVGKSTLLGIMCGNITPTKGGVKYRDKPYLVRQQMAGKRDPWQSVDHLCSENELKAELEDAGLGSLSALKHASRLSDGEARKLHLIAAKLSCPDMLLLDEPTEDLDYRGARWLLRWLSTWENGLVVVSHDRELLAQFEHFFIVTESGCKCFSGGYHDLCHKLEDEAENAQIRYAQKVRLLEAKEEHRSKVLGRRRRKKNYGRISELERCTSRARLNSKRGKAQASQGKAARIGKNRIDSVRDWTVASRRALKVNLPLELTVPQLDTSQRQELLCMKAVTAKREARVLFQDVDLTLGWERLAIVGPNGSGKTTFLNIAVGIDDPYHGLVTVRSERFGYIAQGGANWVADGSLLSLLLEHSRLETLDDVAELLVAHKFPTALASRPLSTLSPGERVRAALICLFQQTPKVHVLALDEPTYSLDFVGETSLRAALKAWPGALIVASHNREFLASIDVSRQLELNGNGGHVLDGPAE